MTIGTQSHKPRDITIQGATAPNIINLNITTINTEFSQALTTGLKQIIIRSRVGANLQYCFASGESNTKYITITKGAGLELKDLSFTGKTLYIRADKVGIVEIQELS